MAEISSTEKSKTSARSGAPRGNAIMHGLGKIAPRALEAEQAVLGALMLEKDAISNVLDLMTPEAFYEDAHRFIYEAIVKLFADSKPVDLITVKNQLQLDGNLEKSGGPLYIVELTSKVASAANIEYHARLIIEKHIQRELIKISDAVIRDAYEDTTDVFDLLDSAERNIFELSQTNLRRNFQDMGNLIAATLKHLEKLKKEDSAISGVPSGFEELDNITAGWQASDLIILAARPAMGKTAFVLSIARNAAVKYNRPVALFSLEMAAQQLAQRLMCSEAELDASKVRTGRLAPHEWTQLNEGVKELSKAPIYIDDTPALSIMDLRTKCRKLKSEKNIEMIIIDYLQLMTAGNSKGGNREQEIAHISRSLKELAKELNVPVIALSQLSRAVEQRPNKEPQLSDLRESGSIEQDADMVMFLYRPEYYNIMQDESGNSTAGMGKVIIGKQRNGPVGSVDLNYIGMYAKFTSLSERKYTPMSSGGDSGFMDTPKFQPSDKFSGNQPQTKTFSSKMNADDVDFDFGSAGDFTPPAGDDDEKSPF
jgi:replicative DNA helicase